MSWAALVSEPTIFPPVEAITPVAPVAPVVPVVPVVPVKPSKNPTSTSGISDSAIRSLIFITKNIKIAITMTQPTCALELKANTIEATIRVLDLKESFL